MYMLGGSNLPDVRLKINTIIIFVNDLIYRKKHTKSIERSCYVKFQAKSDCAHTRKKNESESQNTNTQIVLNGFM